jgi:transposase-like protein
MQIGRKPTFTAPAKRDALMGVLTKRKTVAETWREMGISETTFARWREQPLEGMEAALADKYTRNSREAVLAKQLAEAERTVGRLALENDLPGKASRRLT